MELILRKNHLLEGDDNVLGVCEENKSEHLIIQVKDEKLLDKWAYIEFKLDNGEEYSTEKLPIVDGVIDYEIDNSILVGGYIQMQVVIRGDNDFVWKSFIKKSIVKPSLCVSGNIATGYPDFISKAQKVLDDTQALADDLEEKVASDYFKGKDGEAGPAGPKGDVGNTSYLNVEVNEFGELVIYGGEQDDINFAINGNGELEVSYE